MISRSSPQFEIQYIRRDCRCALLLFLFLLLCFLFCFLLLTAVLYSDGCWPAALDPAFQKSHVPFLWDDKNNYRNIRTGKRSFEAICFDSFACCSCHFFGGEFVIPPSPPLLRGLFTVKWILDYVQFFFLHFFSLKYTNLKEKIHLPSLSVSSLLS